MSTGHVKVDTPWNPSAEPEMKSLRDIKDKLDALAKQVADMGVDLNNHLDEFCDRPEAGDAHLILSAKLDAIAKQQEYDGTVADAWKDSICKKLDTIAESQGKLLAALDGLNAGVAGELGELRKWVSKINDTVVDYIGHRDAVRPPRKRRKRHA